MGLEVYIKVFAVLLLVIALMALSLFVIKYLRIAQFRKMDKELVYSDMLILDNKNKLVLVQRKKTKYLLLLGNSSIVVDIINEG